MGNKSLEHNLDLYIFKVTAGKMKKNLCCFLIGWDGGGGGEAKESLEHSLDLNTLNLTAAKKQKEPIWINSSGFNSLTRMNLTIQLHNTPLPWSSQQGMSAVC